MQFLINSIHKGSDRKTSIKNNVVEGHFASWKLSIQTSTEGLWLVNLKKNSSDYQGWSYVKEVHYNFGQPNFWWTSQIALKKSVNTLLNGDNG